MTDTDTQPPSEVAIIRAKLMEDLADIPVFAKAVGRDPRTIHRMIAKGEIPTVTFGRTRYVVISGARQALMSTPPIRTAPRGRGRPRNAA